METYWKSDTWIRMCMEWILCPQGTRMTINDTDIYRASPDIKFSVNTSIRTEMQMLARTDGHESRDAAVRTWLQTKRWKKSDGDFRQGGHVPWPAQRTLPWKKLALHISSVRPSVHYRRDGVCVGPGPWHWPTRATSPGLLLLLPTNLLCTDSGPTRSRSLIPSLTPCSSFSFVYHASFNKYDSPHAWECECVALDWVGCDRWRHVRQMPPIETSKVLLSLFYYFFGWCGGRACSTIQPSSPAEHFIYCICMPG